MTSVSMGDATRAMESRRNLFADFREDKYTYKPQNATGADQAPPFFEVDVKSGKVS